MCQKFSNCVVGGFLKLAKLNFLEELNLKKLMLFNYVKMFIFFLRIGYIFNWDVGEVQITASVWYPKRKEN